MKFISFIISTMLIVLISQHSTMGLPVSETTVEKECAKGLKMVDGKCMPIEPKLDNNELTPSETTLASEPITTSPVQKDKPCQEGMEHDEHGVCREIQPSQSTTILTETTTVHREVASGSENHNSCPEGTQRDEQGSCQEIPSSSTTAIIIDPKVHLKQDGTCPDDYKMVEGACLFIKPKQKTVLYPNGPTVDYSRPNSMKPRVGDESGILVEKIPVLHDNSCPVGSEYIENGLCERRVLINSNLGKKSDGECREDFELINGKCTYKHSKISDQSQDLTTINPSLVQSETTVVPETNTKLPEPKVEPNVDPKLDVETTTV